MENQFRRNVAARGLRWEGIDLARGLAFAGMVVVNFDLAMVDPARDSSALALALQGRAASVFVGLAGIGLGMGFANRAWRESVGRVAKRSVFLLGVGLLNATIFPPDIIHYYAFYLLAGVCFVRVSNVWIWCSIVAAVTASTAMLGLLDYEAEWNWASLEYRGFWTPEGFVKHLLFNGWHPLFPWMALILFGIWLSRLELSSSRSQWSLFLFGVLVVWGTEFVSGWLRARWEGEWVDLLGTEPIPPGPLFVVAGAGITSGLVGLCLLLAGPLSRVGVVAFLAPAGRMTLTLYLAHIILGMGMLEWAGMLGERSGGEALAASACFSALSITFALAWSRRFRHGPVESIMRKAVGGKGSRGVAASGRREGGS